MRTIGYLLKDENTKPTERVATDKQKNKMPQKETVKISEKK